MIVLAFSFLLFGSGTMVELRAQPDQPAIFLEFENWWQRYCDASEASRPELVAEGKKIATQRKAAISQLIQSDPQKAIELAFYEEYHNALPKSIAALVETHVRGLASLKVERTKKGDSLCKVTLDKATWDAFLYGPRLTLPSREEILIHGVVIEGKIAVDGSPLEQFPNRKSLIEVLRLGEGKKTCPICGEPGTIPGAAGDILLWFDTAEHFSICEKALIEKEMSPEVPE